MGPARLLLALVITLAATAWLGLAWTSPAAAPNRALLPGGESLPEAEPPAGLLWWHQEARVEPEDPLRSTLARLDPAGRIDDHAAGLSYWPLVAADPEREADLASLAPEGSPAESYRAYVVGPGQTLLGIALALDVDVDRLAAINKLANRDQLAIGQRLLVPTGEGEPVRAVVSGRGATLRPRFMWPLRGEVTTDFGERGALWIGGRHAGLDIAGSTGQPILAAEAGKVLQAGWAEHRGYGNYVVIDHGLGFRTVYAHLSAVGVAAGQEVARGQHIGNVGSTGVSTGPHLHFEIQIDGEPRDPLAYLP